MGFLGMERLLLKRNFEKPHNDVVILIGEIPLVLF